MSIHFGKDSDLDLNMNMNQLQNGSDTKTDGEDIRKSDPGSRYIPII